MNKNIFIKFFILLSLGFLQYNCFSQNQQVHWFGQSDLIPINSNSETYGLYSSNIRFKWSDSFPTGTPIIYFVKRVNCNISSAIPTLYNPNQISKAYQANWSYPFNFNTYFPDGLAISLNTISVDTIYIIPVGISGFKNELANSFGNYLDSRMVSYLT